MDEFPQRKHFCSKVITGKQYLEDLISLLGENGIFPTSDFVFLRECTKVTTPIQEKQYYFINLRILIMKSILLLLLMAASFTTAQMLKRSNSESFMPG